MGSVEGSIRAGGWEEEYRTTTIPRDSCKRWSIIPRKHHCTFEIMILEAPALGGVSKENPGTANGDSQHWMQPRSCL